MTGNSYPSIIASNSKRAVKGRAICKTPLVQAYSYYQKIRKTKAQKVLSYLLFYRKAGILGNIYNYTK